MQQVTAFSIRPVRQAQRLTSVLQLLEDASLPRQGVEDGATRLWLAEAEGRPAGAVGLEVRGGHGLLRSLVVAPGCRGQGLGGRLMDVVLEEARGLGLSHLFLLTTTAEAYFPRWGFEVVTRAQVPAALEASEELRGACPASAVVMRRALT